MDSTIRVRVDDDLKTKSDCLFRDLGTDTTTAIKMFLAQASGSECIKSHAAQTNPYAPMTEEEMIAKLKESREQGKYRDADEVISGMRSKYGL